jgi:hypothetical protein
MEALFMSSLCYFQIKTVTFPFRNCLPTKKRGSHPHTFQAAGVALPGEMVHSAQFLYIGFVGIKGQEYM